MKKLNILYIAQERNLGGATRCLLALIDEMQRKGHKVYVIIPTSTCRLADELKKRKVTFYSVFFAWWLMPSYWNKLFKTAFRMLYFLEEIQISIIRKKIKKANIDIVHTNSSVTDFGARLANEINAKHVWHVREYGDADFRLEYMQGKQKSWDYMNKKSDKILFVSNDLYQYFASWAAKEKSKVVYDGITDEYLHKREYNDKNKIVFLMSSNINRNKQQMLVLHAAKHLLDRKVTNFSVFIAGAAASMRDAKEYQQELEEYVEKNLKGFVTLLGNVEDMPQLRKKADVEIVPSNREAFGRVTVEAMFSGMPVIASCAGASMELIEDGVTGLLFSKGDSSSLADKMQFIIENPQYIKRYGENAFERATKKYTAKKNADEIEKIYIELM